VSQPAEQALIMYTWITRWSICKFESNHSHADKGMTPEAETSMACNILPETINYLIMNTQTCLLLQSCDTFHITGGLNFKPVSHGHKTVHQM